MTNAWSRSEKEDGGWVVEMDVVECQQMPIGVWGGLQCWRVALVADRLTRMTRLTGRTWLPH